MIYIDFSEYNIYYEQTNYQFKILISILSRKIINIVISNIYFYFLNCLGLKKNLSERYILILFSDAVKLFRLITIITTN